VSYIKKCLLVNGNEAVTVCHALTLTVTFWHMLEKAVTEDSSITVDSQK
jgi:hypothetical protein